MKRSISVVHLLVALVLGLSMGGTTPAAAMDVKSDSFSLVELGQWAVRFEHLTIDQGLSQSSVYSIFQDSQGFMWFSTDEGLNRYDGSDFVVYQSDPEDPYSLSDNNIRFVAEDSSGYLWIGTEGGGVNRFDRKTGQFTRYRHDPNDPNSPVDDTILLVLVDVDGSIWLGTLQGLDRLDPKTGKFTHFANHPDDPTSLSHDQVFSLYQDREGVVWVGSRDGLNRFDAQTGQFKRYMYDPDNPNGLGDSSITAIYQDRDGMLWLGTYNGLDRFDKQTNQFTHFRYDPTDPYSLGDPAVGAINQDLSGALWIATGSGLDRMDPIAGRFTHFRHDPSDPYSLGPSELVTVYTDRQGNLWIGTGSAGVDKIAGATSRFIHLRQDTNTVEGFKGSYVFVVYQDRQDRLWIGTRDAGLNQWDPKTGKWLNYRSDPSDPESLSNSFVTSIAESRSGEFWLGTFGGGLNRYNLATDEFVAYRANSADPNALPSDIILAVYEDREGILWVGTLYGGLSRFEDETDTFQSFQNDPDDARSLSHNRVWTIYEDRSGALWLGTGSGLDRFDRQSGEFTHFQYIPDPSQPLGDIDIFSILEDSSGALWAGSYGGGLGKLDRSSGTLTPYRIKDGLPSDVVYGILEDSAGYLWLSTNRGLAKFNPRTGVSKNYDVKDGLQSNEFNSGAYFRNDEGMMFFGGINGLTYFSPDEIQDNPSIPPVVLTSLTRGGDPLMNAGTESIRNITLHWPNNYFEFEFAALDFTRPEKNQYAYKLENFDKNWNLIGTKHGGRYTNLPGGTYTLRLRGSNSDGVWNEEGLAIKIKVVPPWWESWLFRGGVILLAASAISVGYWLRVRSVISRNQQLERQVTERTREIERLFDQTKELAVIEERNRLARDLHDSAKQKAFAALAQLGAVRGMVKHDPHLAQTHLEEAEDLVYEVIQELTFLIQEMYPLALKEKGLVTALREYIYEWENRTDIQVVLNVDGVQPLPLHAEQALYRVAQEALANIARHSQATQVEISLLYTPDTAQITIADNGRGFNLNQKSAGIGLRSMRERIAMICGDLKIDTSPGQGTRVIIRADLSKLTEKSNNHTNGNLEGGTHA